MTPTGKLQASRLKERLKNIHFTAIFSSPLQRAMETCLLAGLHPTVEKDAAEWNYGDFEGLTREQIREQEKNWSIFQEGAPGGESPQDVAKRADRLLQKIRSYSGNVALFSHGHFSRVLATRWLQLDVSAGKLFALSVASVSILGFEREQPVLTLWNDTSHL